MLSTEHTLHLNMRGYSLYLKVILYTPNPFMNQIWRKMRRAQLSSGLPPIKIKILQPKKHNRHFTFYVFFLIEELKAHFNFTKTNCFVRDESFVDGANIFVKMIDTALQEHFNSPLLPKNLGIRNILYAELMEQNKREIFITKNLHHVV